jgi:methionyl-tRNA formyltransferase
MHVYKMIKLDRYLIGFKRCQSVVFFHKNTITQGILLQNYQQKNLSLTFFGTDLFSLIILKSLNDLYKTKQIADLNVVTCDSKNELSRKVNSFKANHVIKFCKQNELNYLLWNDFKLNSNYEKFLSNKDFAVVASFGHLIPSKMINLFK